MENGFAQDFSRLGVINIVVVFGRLERMVLGWLVVSSEAHRITVLILFFVFVYIPFSSSLLCVISWYNCNKNVNAHIALENVHFWAALVFHRSVGFY